MASICLEDAELLLVGSSGSGIEPHGCREWGRINVNLRISRLDFVTFGFGLGCDHSDRAGGCPYGQLLVFC